MSCFGSSDGYYVKGGYDSAYGANEVFDKVKIPLILSGAAAVVGWPVALMCTSTIAVFVGGMLASLGTALFVRFGVPALLSSNIYEYNNIVNSFPMRLTTALICIILMNVLIP